MLGEGGGEIPSITPFPVTVTRVAAVDGRAQGRCTAGPVGPRGEPGSCALPGLVRERPVRARRILIDLVGLCSVVPHGGAGPPDLRRPTARGDLGAWLAPALGPPAESYQCRQLEARPCASSLANSMAIVRRPLCSGGGHFLQD